MSKTIDEKVVQMKFDNSNFEKNVAKTMNTLDNLKWNLGKLDCRGTANGLKDIGKAADSVKMNGLSGALETVRVKFSALQVMGITALQNLTTAAMNAGSRIASSLIDPLVNGGKNRALNIQNAKFQIEGLLGTEQYNKQWARIDESINYAVKDTAYGYDSAAKAASQFLASDVKVGEQMDKSLRAISGVAAMTNSTYDDIANVFTRVAGQGRVMAIDLNSLAARGMNAAAVLAKHFNKTETEVRDMVSKGKVSFQDFATAMDNAFGEHAKKGNETFEGALSNMKAAMSRIGAKVWDPLLTNQRDVFNQMRLLINDLNNNYLDAPIKKLNEKLTNTFQNIVKFFELGGVKNIILGIGDVFNYLMSILKPIKEAFREIFPKKSVETLVKYTERFKKFTESLKLSDKAAANIKATFKGLFSVIELGLKGMKALWDIASQLLVKFKDIPGKVIGATGALGQWCTKTAESVKQTGFFQNVVDGTITALSNFGKKIKEVLSHMDIFNGLVAFFKGIFKMISQVVKDVGSVLGEAIQTGDYKKFFEFINTLLTTGILYNFKQCAAAADKFFECFNKGDIISNLGGAMKALRVDLYQMQFVIKAKAIMEIAKALMVLAGACLILALIKPERLGSALTALTVGLAELLAALTIISKFIKTDFKGMLNMLTMVYALQSISKGLLVLAIGLKILSTMDWDGVKKSLVAMGGALAELMIALLIMGKFGAKTFKSGISMLPAAISLVIVAGVLKILATMSWDDIWRSLVVMGLALAELVAALSILGNFGGAVLRSSLSLIPTVTSLLVLSGILKILATMSWDDIWKSIAVMGIALAELTAALTILGNFGGHRIATGFELVLATMSLLPLVGVLKSLAKMNWEDIKKSLWGMGIALAELTACLVILQKFSGFKGAGALSAATGSLVTIALALKLIGSMDPWAIVAALAGLAGAFTILGVAAAVLGGMIPALLGIAGAMALFGVATLAFGVGVMTIAAGIASLATALAGGVTIIVAGITAIILGVAGLVPQLIEIFGQAVGALCHVIGTYAPMIAETILTVIHEILKSLVNHGPEITALLFQFLIGVLKELKNYIPDFIQGIFEVFGAIGEGVMKAIANLNPDAILPAVLSIAGLTAIMFALSALGPLVPQAAIGVLGLGALVAELALVLALFGGLAQIPGLTWIIQEGGNLLQAIGTAIGQFIGGIVGGIAAGASSMLPIIGANLSEFMDNVSSFIDGCRTIDGAVLVGAGILAAAIMAMSASNFIYGITEFITFGSKFSDVGQQLSDFMRNAQEFLNGAQSIDPSILTGVAALAKAIIMLTAADLVQGITKFITFGGSGDLGKFGEQLPPLASAINGFVTNLGNFGEDKLKSVMAAAMVIEALAECASKIPNEGGLWASIVGDNSIADFGDKLPGVAKNLSEFIQNLGTFGDDKVQTAKCACEVLKVLATSAKDIPNTGGMVSWFTGDNDIGTFGEKLPGVGEHIAGFVEKLGSFGEGQVRTVEAACNALVALAKSANQIPNSGGMVTWFAGDNDIGTFGEKLPGVGEHIAAFVEKLGTFGEAQVKTVGAACDALVAISKSAAQIPKTGGIGSWFAGDNDIGKFGEKLPGVGTHIKEFAQNLGTFGEEQIKTTDCAGRAIKMLADSASQIPNTGGIGSWFAGDNDIGEFGHKLPGVGSNLAEFVKNLGTFGEEQIRTTDCAGRAIKCLAEAANQVPNIGGMVVWFAGDNDISTFANKFPDIGKNLAEFVANLGTFGDDQIKTVDSAGQAIKALAEAANQIPNTGGMVAWFTGDNDISTFAGKFPGVGTNIANFAKNLGTFGDDQIKTVQAGGDAIKALAGAANQIPNTGGLKSWFVGDADISKFAGKFESVGSGLNAFIRAIGTFGEDQLQTVKYGVSALTEIAKLSHLVYSDDKLGEKLKNITYNFWDVGSGIANFVKAQKDISREDVVAAADKLRTIVNSVELINNLKADNLDNFKNCLKQIADDGVKIFYESINCEDALGKSRKAAEEFIRAFIESAERQKQNVKNKFREVAQESYHGLNDEGIIRSATNLGRNFVQGFANGITNNKYLARNAGSEVGKAALNAAKQSIDAHSPARETFKLGKFFDQGFTNGIIAYASRVYDASKSVADRAKVGLSNSISKISDMIETDMDTTPVIRPVVDLDGVSEGVGTLNSMFGNGSMTLRNNLNAISSGFRGKNQNGNSEVVSAIDKLRKDLGNVKGDTYQVNGVTYDDGSNVSDAVKTLIRAAKVERRK